MIFLTLDHGFEEILEKETEISDFRNVTILIREFKIIIQLFLPVNVDIHVFCVRVTGESLLILKGRQEKSVKKTRCR